MRAPTDRTERLVTLDFIRGIAVLGIVFANIAAFGQTMMAYIWPYALANPPTPADKLFWLVQYVLVDGKMRGLFTLLFGAGMMLFMQRAWARGATRWLQARRLGWLFLFGLAHFLLLWHGDILQLYAVSGLLLLGTLKWRPKTKLITGLTLFIVGSLAFGAQLGGAYAAAANPAMAARLKPEQRQEVAGAEAKTVKENAELIHLYRDGSFTQIARHMVLEKAGPSFGQTIFLAQVETMPLALIGMALFELGLFNGGIDPAVLRRRGWIGVLAGSAITLALGLWAYLADFPYWLTFFVFIGASPLPRLAVILGLAALFALWAPRATQTALGGRLVYAGRMAFSNYLGTSLLLVPIFNGWGLGLFGRFGRAELFGFVVAVWILMLLWSKAWLERYRYGPLEWLWRCLTYGRMFPLRR
ncbi:MAG: DUF418 domain-containing protein [Novosphingobium sp.]